MDHRGVVVTPAMDVVVLVHAETPEGEGCAVDEESCPLDPYGANADRQCVAVDDGALVVDELCIELVEVAASGSPQLRSRHPQFAAGTECVGDHGAPGVSQPHPDRCRTHQGDRVVDHAGRALDVGRHRDVRDVGVRRRVQPDAPVEPRIVEEVVVLPLSPAPVRHHLHDPRREGLPRQLVVDDHGEAEFLTRSDQGGHVGLEWRVATLVLRDAGVPDPDRGPVRRRIEPQDDSLSGPAAGNEDRALVPHVAHVVVDVRIDEHIVEAARNGHPAGVGQRRTPPAFRTARAGGIEGEAPDAVEPLGLSAAVVLRPEHEVLLFPLLAVRRAAGEQFDDDVGDGLRNEVVGVDDRRRHLSYRPPRPRPWRPGPRRGGPRGAGGGRPGEPGRQVDGLVRSQMSVSARAARTAGSRTTPPGAASTAGDPARRIRSTSSDSRCR